MKSNLLLSIFLLFLISCNKNDEVSEKDSLSIYCCGTKNPQWLVDEMEHFSKIYYTNPATTMSISSFETDSIEYIAIALIVKKTEPMGFPFFFTCTGRRIDSYPHFELRKLFYDNKFTLLWKKELDTKE